MAMPEPVPPDNEHTTKMLMPLSSCTFQRSSMNFSWPMMRPLALVK